MKIIYTRKGEEILVDDEDYDLLSQKTWHVNASGYVKWSTRLGVPKGKKYVVSMHRYLLKLDTDDKRMVDHKNGNKLDNRRENLRICTSSQNSCNRRVMETNSLGIKGVSPAGKKYRALIYLHGKKIHLGMYPTPELAAEMYALAADMLHGEFANHGI